MLSLNKRSILGQRKPLEEAEMDITPMIDCTFLLLIFFLVTSQMDVPSPVRLPEAQHGQTVVEKDAVMLTVIKGSGEVVQVYKGTEQTSANLIDAATIIEQEEQIAEYVEQQAAAEGKRHVLIKAERDVKHRDVARVQRAAGRAEVDQLYVAVTEAK